MSRRETFPPPRPCVAIRSIPVCDERQKLLIGGCAASRKAAACCVTKTRSSPGRAAKIPSEAASLREKSFPQCRAKFSAVGRANISADRDTNALHHRRSKKVPASEPKEFSPRGAGNKRRSAVMRGKKVFRLPCSSRNRSVVSVGLRGVSAAVVLRCDKLHPSLQRAAKLLMSGCAVSCKAAARCVRKARFSTGARRKSLRSRAAP